MVRLAPSENEGCIGFLGAFASPATESAFRQRHIRDDLWLMRFLVIAGMVRVSVMLLSDYQDFGVGPGFWSLLFARLLLLLISVGVFFALGRVRSAVTAGRLFFGWGLLLVGLTVGAISARPPGDTTLLLMSFSMVLVIYCVAPLPLAWQALLALSYSAAVLCISRQGDSEALGLVGMAHGLANLFGAIASWRLNHRRRQMFLGALREAELRTSLEEAAAEIRTLRGLLCICAWCKRIRDEEESWQTVEAYVQNRTHASFTHSICPDCLQAQVGTVAAWRC